MKRRKIKLSMTNKEEEYKRPIKTTVVNEFFAVHGTVTDKIDRNDVTLTHIPTGFAVVTRGFSKESLIRAADKLLELGDWNFTNPEGAKRFHPKEIMNVLESC